MIPEEGWCGTVLSYDHGIVDSVLFIIFSVVMVIVTVCVMIMVNTVYCGEMVRIEAGSSHDIIGTAL